MQGDVGVDGEGKGESAVSGVVTGDDEDAVRIANFVMDGGGHGRLGGFLEAEQDGVRAEELLAVHVAHVLDRGEAFSFDQDAIGGLQRAEEWGEDCGVREADGVAVVEGVEDGLGQAGEGQVAGDGRGGEIEGFGHGGLVIAVMGGEGLSVGLGTVVGGDVGALAVVDVGCAEGFGVGEVLDVGEEGDFEAVAVEVKDGGVTAVAADDFVVVVRVVWVGWDGADEGGGDLAVGFEGLAEGWDDAGLGLVAGAAGGGV